MRPTPPVWPAAAPPIFWTDVPRPAGKALAGPLFARRIGRTAAGGPFFGRRQTACSRRPAPGGAPVRPAVSRALCGGPHAPWDALRALRCPCAHWDAPPCGLWCPCALWDALCALGCPHAPLRCPLRALGLPYTLRVALRASRSLAAHHAPQYRARLSPAPRRPSAPPRRARQRKSPAAPKGAAGPCSFRCQAMRLR